MQIGADIYFDTSLIAAELELPPLIFPVFGLCVGRPDPATENAVKPRLVQQAVLHRERYDWSRQREPIERYDERMIEFRREQGVDLSKDPQALQRLKEGKVYMPAQAERAARNFFRKGNLLALRELALRRTADRVDQAREVASREYAAPVMGRRWSDLVSAVVVGNSG